MKKSRGRMYEQCFFRKRENRKTGRAAGKCWEVVGGCGKKRIEGGVQGSGFTVSVLSLRSEQGLRVDYALTGKFKFKLVFF